MKYDPEDKELFFSTSMIPDKEETNASLEHFEDYRLECFKNTGSWIKQQVKGSAEIGMGAKIMGSVIGISLFVGIMFGMACIIKKSYDYIPWIIGIILLELGINAFVYADATGLNAYTESALCMRIGGVISIAGAAGLVVVGYVYPKEIKAYYLMALFCELAFVVFLRSLVKVIGFVMAPKSVYKEEVQATCIGYVRTYQLYGEDGGNYLPVNSPLFEYYFEGSKYQSYYDLWDNGTDGKIETGSSCKIKIAPNDPSRVLGGKNTIISAPLTMTFLSFAAFVMLLVLLIV